MGDYRTFNQHYLRTYELATFANDLLEAGGDVSLFTAEVQREESTLEIYRIDFTKPNKIELKTLGVDTFDEDMELSFDSVDKLPMWIQKKLALLSMIEYGDTNPDVPKVGRRISPTVYWVYPN